MPLHVGTRLGVYEITAPLGAGGMGEVFRARDTRLGREVAIKGLPEAFASHPERLARFEREARLLASLSHPNIAAIYGLEETSGTPYLVLELVDGESLAQRLARGALPVREALETAVQIAAAVEAAHERGIVHRDLKPGNVMLAASHVVKVLDFGLAKGGALEGGGTGALSASPTMAASGTALGLVLGTVSYMSPEQARGLAVDRRTDVWALGCVLYECLSGRQAFAGPTTSDVIGRILEREPDWAALPAATPARARDFLRRCLTKDAEARPRDIGDLRRELASIVQDLSSPAGAQPGPGAGAAPSLAVLYFENLAKDPESEYFCAGVTEDILTDLSKIRGLRVASRNAVTRYRGQPTDLPRVATELGVGAVLEGTVRRAGDRVRIAVQLVDARSGFHLWAERYDRTLEDVFAVQDEIATAIAGALRVTLAPGEAEKIAAHRPDDVRAYDLYLKGRALYNQYSNESLHEALALFRQAAELDPNYALAWAGIADCYGQLFQWGHDVTQAELERHGGEAAQKALALDPRLPEAHKALALVLRFTDDPVGERAALRRALECNPRFTPALLNLGVSEFSRADLAGAERCFRRTLEIDPQEAFATLSLMMVTGTTLRLHETIELAARLRGMTDEPFYRGAAYNARGRAYLKLDDLDAAERTFREAAADGLPPDRLAATEAWLQVRRGRTEEARALVRALDAMPNLGSGANIAGAHAALLVGEPEAALRFMSSRRVVDLAQVICRLDPGLHPLLDRPPFAPRRLDATLVWPIEAPMIDGACFRLFREVKLDTGLPEGSAIR